MKWSIDNGNNCEYCGQTFTSSNSVTTDHLIPKAKFGSYANEAWNLVHACRDCNLRKADYFNLSIPFIPVNRNLLIEDVRINRLKLLKF